MKKIILTISALALFLAVNAQKTFTENWPNGNKKAEGIILGNADANASDSKSEQARKMENNVKDGKWTTWFENGTVRSEEFYDKGKMTGTWKVVYENGQTESLIDFSKGTSVTYYKNGKISSEGAIANEMVHQGKWMGNFESGNKNYEGSYDANGKKDGTWTWWNEKGELSSEQVFKNGSLINTRDLSKK